MKTHQKLTVKPTSNHFSSEKFNSTRCEFSNRKLTSTHIISTSTRESLFSSQLFFIETSNDEQFIIEFSNDDEFESSQLTSRTSLTSQFMSRASLTFQFTFRAFNTSFVSFFELQRVSTQTKTTYIINEMRKIKFFFNDMFEKIMNSNSHKNMKNNLLNKLQSS
jgi:hypothetical protein